MPKETVHYPEYIEGEVPGVEVAINWSSGDNAHAQISFEFSVSAMLNYLTQLRKDSPGDATAIWYTPSLNRPELQKLISVTRRARNAVYGGDE